MSDDSFASNPLLANDPDFVPPKPTPRVPPRDQAADVPATDYRPIVSAPRPVQTPAPAAATEPDEHTTIDALADDAAPAEWPADAPPLWPYLKLPFRERAEFFKVYEQLQAKQGLLNELREGAKTEKPASGSAATAARVFELYAVMDDLMMICAVDKERYRAWVATHEDEQFAQLFGAFMARTQPGEASRSAS